MEETLSEPYFHRIIGLIDFSLHNYIYSLVTNTDFKTNITAFLEYERISFIG
jgi:hypothetical protein